MSASRFDLTTLPVAQIVSATEAEGPGRRFAVWLQGCPLRCPGCCNPEMLAFDGGQAVSIGNLLQQIKQASTRDSVEGITLLGGEPFAHAAGAAVLAGAVQDMGLSVMVFSGFVLDALRAMTDPAVAELLRRIDILVDGPYIRELPETERRWIGSSNQQVHFLTDRYRADDPCWRLANTLEIRFERGALAVNGFPARAALGLWQRPG